MNAFFSILKEKLGVSKAIAYTFLARAIQGVGGVVSIFFVTHFLSSEEQGYYYTFGSILSIQIFIELGLGGIITQFVAHEYAHLKVSDDCKLYGDVSHLSRLSSLVRFFAKWYILSSVILFILLLIVGFKFFSTYSVDSGVIWNLPWLILALATALNLLISPIFAFIEGINRVSDVAFIRLITQIVSLIGVWSVLALGGKLYASAITSCFAFLVSVSLLYVSRNNIKILKNVFSAEVTESVSYLKEVFPYQWRIALSLMSGYFIFQLFNPVLFAYCGPESAGQMGMTLTVLNGVLNLTLSWTSTNVPFWSSLIAMKKFDTLDLSFTKVLKSSSFVCLSGILTFLLLLYLIYALDLPLYNRFLPLYLAAIMSITFFINNIVNAWATYLRCHKKEPFLIQAFVVGLCSALTTILTAKFIGVEGVVIGYASVVALVSLPLSYYIFKTKKVEYNV